MTRRLGLRWAHLLTSVLILSGLSLSSVQAQPDFWPRLLQEAQATHTSALVVLKAGEAPRSYYLHGKSEKIHAMSATKSVMALGIGLLIQQGKLASVDVPVSEFYPEWRQGRKREITVRHLLTHSSGLQDLGSTQQEIYPSPDFVQLALSAELSHDPGSRFFYSNKATNLIAGVIAKAAGQPMDRYLGEQLFKPLGIQDWAWTRDSAGNPHGMAGLQIHPEDLAKIGQLMLQKGQWQGKTLLSAEWITQAVTPSALEPSCAWLWWLNPASVEFIIDRPQLEALAAAGIDPDFIRRLEPAIGEYPDYERFTGRLSEVLGPEWLQDFLKAKKDLNITLSRKRIGPMIGYSARGYLGQYLVVLPELNLVAVRMIGVQDYTQPADDFIGFESRLYALAQAKP